MLERERMCQNDGSECQTEIALMNVTEYCVREKQRVLVQIWVVKSALNRASIWRGREYKILGRPEQKRIRM